MWSGAQPERTCRPCVTSFGLLSVGDKSRTHKRGTTPKLPRQTWPVTKAPSAQAELPKTLQDAELEKLVSHCGPNRRHNLNADVGTRKGNKTSAQSVGCQRTPVEGEGRQLVADVGPPSRKTFNIVLRPSHVRAEETKGVNEDVKQGTAMLWSGSWPSKQLLVSILSSRCKPGFRR